jgi:hypothetical protein
MYRRTPLMQQADAAGAGAAAGAAGAAGAAAGAGAGAAAGAAAGSAAAGAADKNGQQQQAGQQSKTQEGAASSQAGAQQQSTQGTQSTDSAKGAGAASTAKPGDQAQVVIKLPAGYEANPDAVEAGEHYGAWAKSKLGLTQEHAQAAFDYFIERSKESEGALQKQIVRDIDALKADKEFGGANYDKTLAARDSAAEAVFRG